MWKAATWNCQGRGVNIECPVACGCCKFNCCCCWCCWCCYRFCCCCCCCHQ